MQELECTSRHWEGGCYWTRSAWAHLHALPTTGSGPWSVNEMYLYSDFRNCFFQLLAKLHNAKVERAGRAPHHHRCR